MGTVVLRICGGFTAADTLVVAGTTTEGAGAEETEAAAPEGTDALTSLPLPCCCGCACACATTPTAALGAWLPASFGVFVLFTAGDAFLFHEV